MAVRFVKILKWLVYVFIYSRIISSICHHLGHNTFLQHFFYHRNHLLAVIYMLVTLITTIYLPSLSTAIYILMNPLTYHFFLIHSSLFAIFVPEESTAITITFSFIIDGSILISIFTTLHAMLVWSGVQTVNMFGYYPHESF